MIADDDEKSSSTAVPLMIDMIAASPREKSGSMKGASRKLSAQVESSLSKELLGGNLSANGDS